MRVEDPATPFFTRLYKKHHRMVEYLLKEPDMNTNADVARIAIEDLYNKRKKKNKK